MADAPFAAGVMIADPGGRLLFLKRKDGKGWAWPGGKIEPDETPEQAAGRETLEETGFSTGNLTQIDEGMGFVTFRSEADSEFDPSQHADFGREHDEHVWAMPDNAPQPLHPGVAATLTKMTAMDFNVKEGFRQNAAKAKELSERTDMPTIKNGLDPELLDAAALDRREYDSNNWYEVLDNPLSKVGVYQYSEASIRRGGDRNKMVGVYRPAEELGSPECVNSFRLMPWTDDHPRDLLGDPAQGYVATDEKGVHGVIGEKTYFQDGTLYGNLKVFSQAHAQKIAAGKRELSCGYHCDFVPEEGVYKGTPYQYVQKNMRGNHVASVKAGRMGSDVRVLDAAEAALTFAFDMKEIAIDAVPCAMCGRAHEGDDCLDAETAKFVADSFESLVGELERKGYSKEYATKVAGKVAAEKGMTGHDSKSTSEDKTMAAKDANGDVKDPVKKDDKPSDTASPGAKDWEEKEKMEAAKDEEEEMMDAEEEKKDKEDKSMDAVARMRARDRRAGARDARRSARDSAKSARDAKAAADAKAAQDARGGAIDAKEFIATEVAKQLKAGALDASDITRQVIAQVVPAIRKEEAAKSSLYGRLSPIVGAFDHSEMTHTDMASYGLQKLGAPKASDPVMALDYLLAGRAQAVQAQAPRYARSSAQDGSGASFVDSYLAPTH